jgi:hypothetical protein
VGKRVGTGNLLILHMNIHGWTPWTPKNTIHGTLPIPPWVP